MINNSSDLLLNVVDVAFVINRAKVALNSEFTFGQMTDLVIDNFSEVRDMSGIRNVLDAKKWVASVIACGLVS